MQTPVTNGVGVEDQASSSSPERGPSLEVGDRVLARYRGDQYRARVEAVDNMSVTVKWAPPHDRWGVATLDAADIELVSRPEKPDALAHLLPGALADPRGGPDLPLREAFRDVRAVGIYFVDTSTPPAETSRLAAFAASLPPGSLGIAVYELGNERPDRGALNGAASPASLAGQHATLLPGCLACKAENVALVLQNWNLVEVCRVRRLPSLCVATRASEILTYDGLEALSEQPLGFPWRGFKSRSTRRVELKERRGGRASVETRRDRLRSCLQRLYDGGTLARWRLEGRRKPQDGPRPRRDSSPRNLHVAAAAPPRP